MNVVEGILYLGKCALLEQIPDRELISALDMDSLYHLASTHMVAASVGHALEQAGICDSRFREAIAKNNYKVILMDSEKKKIFAELNRLEIWYVALKGDELRRFYPKTVLRECADIDILFDVKREAEVKEMMIGLGYMVKSYAKGHHDEYKKKQGVTVEMHLALFGVDYDKKLNEYFDNPKVEKRLINGDGMERHFSKEDFYIYFIAHNYSHYSNGGVGLKSLFDTWVFLNANKALMDWDYISSELSKLEIQEYELENRTLAGKIFANEELTSQEQRMLDYIAGSGAYGTVSNKVENRIERAGSGTKGKVRYFWSRMWAPMDVVEHYYPLFYKHKVLLPLLPLYRAYKGWGKHKESVKNELKAFWRKR